MPLQLVRINYTDLNSKQQENYNFQKISAILADYGFATLHLSDDWQGADFIAQHVDGETFLKVQLKGRLIFSKKYVGKGIYIAFHEDGEWFLYPHDDLLAVVLAEKNVAQTRSWQEGGMYSFSSLSRQLRLLLADYRIVGNVKPGEANP